MQAALAQTKLDSEASINPVTACVIWEAFLEMRDSLPMLDAKFKERGTCEMREVAVALSPEIDRRWNALTLDQQEKFGPFDWNFVPLQILGEYPSETN